MEQGRRWMLQNAVGWLPTALTLAALAAVGVWGVSTGWRAPQLWGETDDTADKETRALATRVITTPASPSSDPNVPATPETRIEFSSADAVRKTGIEVAAATQQQLAQYVLANGTVAYCPNAYALLSSRAAGTAWEVEKHIGQPVLKGEVLALIESAEVGKAKADLLQALTQVEMRQQALKTLTASGGAVPAADVRTASAALREARVRVFNDQQALLNLGLSVRPEDMLTLAEDQRVQQLRLLGLPAEVRARLGPDAPAANLLPLLAPFDGQVVRRSVAVGEAVAPGRSLFVVASTRRVHLELAIEPGDVAKLRLGQQVTFTPDGVEGVKGSGSLEHISPEVDEKTRKVWVHTEADNPDGQLRPNSFGKGRILVREQPSAVVVPAEALQTDGPTHLVFVRVTPTVFQVRQVRPGIRDGAVVAVDGVRPGEEVVTTGSHILRSELLKDRMGGGD